MLTWAKTCHEVMSGGLRAHVLLTRPPSERNSTNLKHVAETWQNLPVYRAMGRNLPVCRAMGDDLALSLPLRKPSGS